MSEIKPRIAIITMVIGADYTKAMEPGLESKRQYAKKHGYDLHIGGAEVWDRKRPIPWSKLPFMLKFLDDYDYLFWSDADVVIMNQDIQLETHIVPLLPPHKDLLWTKDVCGNLNSGNMLIRGKSAWVRQMFKRTYEQEDLIHHIWWENAAICHLMAHSPVDTVKIECTMEAWRFNAYLCGVHGARLWMPGDLLVHFAGVYEPTNMVALMDAIDRGETPRIPMT